MLDAKKYAVIFDMDGVMVDTFHPHFESWLECARERGVEFTQDEFKETFGRTSREIIAHFWGEGVLSEEDMKDFDRRKEALFRQMIEKDFPAMEGISELLHSLKKEGFCLAVGSSGPKENVEMVVKKLKAEAVFDVLVHGGDVEKGKPDAAVFLLAAKRMKIDPPYAAVIEDAPPGVEAARKAGMTAIGFTSTGRKASDLHDADYLINSLKELSPEKIRGWIDAKRKME